MELSITRDPYGNTPYAGGEYRSRETFGYGMYDVKMKPIKNDGVVSSFFTYTGPTDGTVWDEIDIEFLGKNTNQVQFNYYTNGVGNHEYLYDLGFDASQSFHSYGFLWEQGCITWFVDNKPVYKATQNIPTTPGKIMMNAWNGVNVDSWLKPFNGRTGLTAYYDWASYTSLSKVNGSNNSSSNNNNNQNNNNPNNNNQNYNNNTSNNNQNTQYSNDGIESGRTYALFSAYNKKTLDIAYWSKDNGANIQQWSDAEGYSPQQLWKFEKVGDAYKIINVNSGKAIDIAGH